MKVNLRHQAGASMLASLAMGCIVVSSLVPLVGCAQPPKDGSANKTPESNQTTGTKQPVPAPGVAALSANVAMSSLREKAIAIVEDTFRGEDPALRANAVEAATYASARLKGIITAGLQDPNSGVRGVAASAVGRAELKGYTALLQPLLRDEQSITQVSALFALLRTGTVLDRTPFAYYLMKDESPWAKRQAVDALGLLGEPSAKGLLRAAAAERFPTLSPSQTRLLHLQISQALVRLGDDSQRQAIRAALYPSQPDELEAAVLAVQMIGETQDKEAAGQLINLSEFKDRTGNRYPPEVRLAVAGALAQLGMTEGSFVADEYLADPSPSVRAQAAFVYGVTRGKSNGAKLEKLMNDPDVRVRISAAASVLKSLARR